MDIREKLKTLLEKSVMKYENQSTYKVNTFDLDRALPLRNVAPNLWIASDAELVLTDVDFIKKAGEKIASDLEGIEFDCILTVEAKAIPICYKICECLDIKTFALARKSVKSYMKNYLEETVKSITTSSIQKLVLDEDNIAKIKGKNIVVFDDVISTGGTINGLINLAKRLKSSIVKVVTIWLEGSSPFIKFIDDLMNRKLIFYDILPLFARGEIYNSLLEEKKKAEEIIKKWEKI